MAYFVSAFIVVTTITIGIVVCHEEYWIPGGLTHERKANSDIQALVDSVRPDVEEHVRQNFPKFKAVSYKSQVVQGAMYYVKVRVESNKYIHVKIWRKLNGNKEYQTARIGKSRYDAIEYFTGYPEC